MQKTLFSKYFTVCAGIILATLVFAGGIFLVLSTNNFQSEKYALLIRNAQHAAALTVNDYIDNNGTVINTATVAPGYIILGDAADTDIFLVDTDGKTLICSETGRCKHKSYIVPKEIMDKALMGEYTELGRLGGMYRDRYYTVGVPLQLDSSRVGGVVFASSSAKTLNTFLMSTLRLFTLASLGVLSLCFIILYFVTKRMVKPLVDMADVAQCFGKGDFSKRVGVDRLDEIGQLSIAFNNMASSLAMNESTRRSFIANVSHELKTPMTTISGFVDGILDGTIPPEQQEYYLRIVSQEVKRLSRVVRSMLNIAKIESGEVKLAPVPIDVHETICSIIFTFEQKIEEKRIDVRGLDCPKVMVDADPDLIHQAMYNLIENAVKFVDEDGYLEFSFENAGPNVYISIKNSGKGIAKEEIPRIFDRFYKSDVSRSLDKTGVGLGLNIVRSIINLHGGDIVVRSVEGEYCAFTVTLPQSKNSANLFKKNSNSQ